MTNEAHPERTSPVALACVWHAILLIVFLTWRYGGMEETTRTIALFLAAPAPILSFLAWRSASPEIRSRAMRIAVPLAILTGIVLTSFFNPSMQQRTFFGNSVVTPRPFVAWLPSTPLPSAASRDFALNLCLLLAGANVMLSCPRRRWLRRLVMVVALNTCLLALVGSLFKLSGATKILGITPSTNSSFFATFVYHNHWGAVALLGVAAATSLAVYHVRRSPEAWHETPAPLWASIALVIALAIPLSTARGSTAAVVAFALLMAAVAVTTYRSHRRMIIGALVAGLVLLGGSAAFLARDAIANEVRETRLQWSESGPGAFGELRITLYRDTVKLIEQKPWLGWGWESFRYVYPRVQSRLPYMQTSHFETHVLDAHNDWLQLVAELGVIGFVLFLLISSGWLRWAGWAGWMQAPSREILAGLACVALLALIDFPTACPAVVVSGAALLGAAAELARRAPHSHHEVAPC